MSDLPTAPAPEQPRCEHCRAIDPGYAFSFVPLYEDGMSYRSALLCEACAYQLTQTSGIPGHIRASQLELKGATHPNRSQPNALHRDPRKQARDLLAARRAFQAATASRNNDDLDRAMRQLNAVQRLSRRQPPPASPSRYQRATRTTARPKAAMPPSAATKRGGGPKPGVTASPDFAGRLLAVVKAHIDEYDRDPGPATAAASFGKSYSTLNRWLGKHRLRWSDITLAASYGSLREGEDYLVSLQQKRRQQRV